MVCSSVKWYDSLSQEGTKQSSEPGQQGSSPCGCHCCPQQASSCLLFGLDFWLVESRLLSLGVFSVSELEDCLFYSFCGVLSRPCAHANYSSQATGRVQKSRPARLTGRSSRSARAAFHINNNNNNNKLDKNQLKIFTESLVTSGYLWPGFFSLRGFLVIVLVTVAAGVSFSLAVTCPKHC